MATATFKKAAPKVTTKVTLELSEREAQILKIIIGNTQHSPCDELHSIYYDLDKAGISSDQFRVTSGNIKVTETE